MSKMVFREGGVSADFSSGFCAVRNPRDVSCLLVHPFTLKQCLQGYVPPRDHMMAAKTGDMSRQNGGWNEALLSCMELWVSGITSPLKSFFCPCDSVWANCRLLTSFQTSSVPVYFGQSKDLLQPADLVFGTWSFPSKCLRLRLWQTFWHVNKDF